MFRRICLILANEGFIGLFRRIILRLHLAPVPPDVKEGVDKEKKAYIELRETFLKKAVELGYGDLSRYYWYHTIDLGRGLVTPGAFDHRPVLSTYCFPKDMSGMRVLDIGAHSGFFTFEFEKRGADVTSVELPSLFEIDVPVEEDRERALKEHMAELKCQSIDELYHFILDGPFQFCRKALNSKIKRAYSNIYNVNAGNVGTDFDLVYIGDVLLHTISPFKALAAVAPLCKKTLMISQEFYNSASPDPVMRYLGEDKRCIRWWGTWWYPNLICMERMLKRLGFKSVKVVGSAKFYSRTDKCYYEPIHIVATK